MLPVPNPQSKKDCQPLPAREIMTGQKMTEKVYVIGSNSFTGATFVDYLLPLGCEVMACAARPAGRGLPPLQMAPPRPGPRPVPFRQTGPEPRHRPDRPGHPRFPAGLRRQFRRPEHGGRKLALSRPMVHHQRRRQRPPPRKTPAIQIPQEIRPHLHAGGLWKRQAT